MREPEGRSSRPSHECSEAQRIHQLHPEIAPETVEAITRALVNQIFHLPSERLRRIEDAETRMRLHEAFLTHLAADRHVAPATHRQALSALLFLYRKVLGVDLGDTNVVPVDYVAKAMDHIAHLPDRDGEAFHLVNPEPQPVVDMINSFCAAAGAPRFATPIDRNVTAGATGLLPRPLRPSSLFSAVVRSAPAHLLLDQIHKSFRHYQANFDLEDCDRILRVESEMVNGKEIGFRTVENQCHNSLGWCRCATPKVWVDAFTEGVVTFTPRRRKGV